MENRIVALANTWLSGWHPELTKFKRKGIGNTLLVPIQSVLSLAGVSDLKKMWEIHEEKGGSSHVAAQEVSERCRLASPIELLPLNVEQILIHDELDRHVPVDLSVKYHRRAIEQGDFTLSEEILEEKKEYDTIIIYDYEDYPDIVSGRCDNCGKAQFESSVKNYVYIRKCKECGRKKSI
ncbi:S9 family peptidase [Peribacillus simplex]|uniref:alpha/beta hydrolase family protein n=1 Tax=Peribacillus simplex TaxID=1478 RepID=UPI001C87D54A|nr:hypothetical protein [Peribacillus simplex]